MIKALLRWLTKPVPPPLGDEDTFTPTVMPGSALGEGAQAAAAASEEARAARAAAVSDALREAQQARQARRRRELLEDEERLEEDRRNVDLSASVAVAVTQSALWTASTDSPPDSSGIDPGGGSFGGGGASVDF